MAFRSLRKYFKTFQNSFSSVAEYRADSVTIFLHEILGIFSWIVLWSAVYSTRNQIKGYDFNDSVVYFLAVSLTGFISHISVASDIGFEIRFGQLSKFLVRPYKIWAHYLASTFGKKSVYTSIVLPIYALIFIFLNHSFAQVLPFSDIF